MKTYIHQLKEWPNLTWDIQNLMNRLLDSRHKQGRLIGKMEALGFSLRSEAMLQTMTSEVLQSNAIEGEFLNEEQIRSSIARKLELEIGGLVPIDKNVDGIVEVMLDATQHFNTPLTKERLFKWHSLLFPDHINRSHKITIGDWRKSGAPMQVVSGPMGKEKVHFQAPEDSLVSNEMSKFLKWFNQTHDIDPVLKAGVAHFWFVTIHPFDDGNGRLARAIADMQLAKSDGLKQRFYSMSAQIRLDRKSYYDILEKTQSESIDITHWLEWFLICLDRALELSEITLSGVKKKSRFNELLSTKTINDRQRLILNKLLDQFDGKLTSMKYAKIAKCSTDTALRDIQNLITQEVLIKDPGGSRSTSYSLVEI